MTNLVQFPGLGLSFELDRVAFSIGGMNIYWYGVCIAVGMCLALVFAFRHSVEFGVDADAMVDVILIGVVMGILCARLYYVALSPYQYHSLKDVLAIRDGGLAIYGGVIGAFLFGGLACKWRKVPMLPMFDLAAMGFLIGQGCGRWGNFFNQEAFGCNTTLPWGMYSEATRNSLMGSTVTAQKGVVIDPNLPVHPTFLYESIWCFVGFALLWCAESFTLKMRERFRPFAYAIVGLIGYGVWSLLVFSATINSVLAMVGERVLTNGQIGAIALNGAALGFAAFLFAKLLDVKLGNRKTTAIIMLVVEVTAAIIGLIIMILMFRALYAA